MEKLQNLNAMRYYMTILPSSRIYPVMMVSYGQKLEGIVQ